jgi:hypothetical protein
MKSLPGSVHGGIKRLRKIGQEIDLILEPNRKPYQAVADPGGGPFIRTHACMSHRGGMGNEAFMPPSDAANENIFIASIKRRTELASPEISKLSIDPNPRCCDRAIAWR